MTSYRVKPLRTATARECAGIQNPAPRRAACRVFDRKVRVAQVQIVPQPPFQEGLGRIEVLAT